MFVCGMLDLGISRMLFDCSIALVAAVSDLAFADCKALFYWLDLLTVQKLKQASSGTAQMDTSFFVGGHHVSGTSLSPLCT